MTTPGATGRAREYSDPRDRGGSGGGCNRDQAMNDRNMMAAANAAERATLGLPPVDRSPNGNDGGRSDGSGGGRDGRDRGGSGGNGNGGQQQRRRPPAYDCDDHSWCCQPPPPRGDYQRSTPQASPQPGGTPAPPATPPQIDDGVPLWPGVSKLRPNRYGLVGAAGAHVGSRQTMEDRHRVAYGGVGLTPNGPTQLYRGFFGVYDGHGGQESAHWCATHIHEMLAICAAPPLPAMSKAPEPATRDGAGKSGREQVAVIPLSSISAPSSLAIPGQPESSLGNLGPSSGGVPTSHTPVLALSSPLMTLAPVIHTQDNTADRKETKGGGDQPLLTIGSDAMKKLIERAFLRSEEEVLVAARRAGFKDGTCASCIIVAGDMLFCANVGDSRSVLCRDGQAIALSRDHKPHDPDEKKRIESVGGSVHPVMRERPAVCCFKAAKVPYGADRLWPGGFSVSRALGDIDYKDLRRGKVKVVGTLIARPDVSVTSLTPYDRFAIVASDGLWDVMTSQEAVDFVLRESKLKTFDAERIGEKMVHRAFQLGSEDNISVIVVFFTHYKTWDT